MQLQQESEQEKSEQWRSAASALDQQEADENRLDTMQLSPSVQGDTAVAKSSGMAKAIAIIIAIRFFSQFILGTALSYLLAKYIMPGTHAIPGWYNVAIFILNIGMIVWIGQIVARLAPRQVILSIAYGNAAGFIFNLIQLASLYFLPNPNIHAMLPRMFMEGLFWTFTAAVTEIVIAQYFVRRYEKEITTAYRKISR